MSSRVVTPSESTTATATSNHGELEPPTLIAQTSVSDSSSPPRPRKRKWPLGVGLAAIVVAVAAGIPWLRESLTTISTDDAYVNGHVTFVAPRVSGQVKNVLVDDNNVVHKGDLLIELDPEPFQVQVNIAEATVTAAKADLIAAQAAIDLPPGMEPVLKLVDREVPLVGSSEFGQRRS